MARDKPELVRAFLRGLKKGQDWAATDQAGAVQHLLDANQDLEEDTVEAPSLTWTSAPVLSPSDVPTLHGQPPPQWAAFATWMTDNGLISGPVQRGRRRDRRVPARGPLTPWAPPADVVVVGAGPVGARDGLAGRGRRARRAWSWFNDGAPPAAHVAAGMLGPWSEAEEGEEDLHPLMVDAAGAAGRASRTELAAASGHDGGPARTGAVLPAASRPEHIPIDPKAARGDWHARGAPTPWCSGLGAPRPLEPGLGPAIAGGAHLPDEHQTEPRSLLAALRDGGRVRRACAT